MANVEARVWTSEPGAGASARGDGETDDCDANSQATVDYTDVADLEWLAGTERGASAAMLEACWAPTFNDPRVDAAFRAALLDIFAHCFWNCKFLPGAFHSLRNKALFSAVMELPPSADASAAALAGLSLPLAASLPRLTCLVFACRVADADGGDCTLHMEVCNRQEGIADILAQDPDGDARFQLAAGPENCIGSIMLGRTDPPASAILCRGNATAAVHLPKGARVCCYVAAPEGAASPFEGPFLGPSVRTSTSGNKSLKPAMPSKQQK